MNEVANSNLLCLIVFLSLAQFAWHHLGSLFNNLDQNKYIFSILNLVLLFMSVYLMYKSFWGIFQ